MAAVNISARLGVGLAKLRGVARQFFLLWLCAPLVPSLSEAIGLLFVFD